ncbi:putative reverse transcriptase domain-containing protein [Tanacetum coccineum]
MKIAPGLILLLATLFGGGVTALVILMPKVIENQIQSCLLHHLRLPTHLSTPILSQGGYFRELSDGGSPRVIVYGYDGLPMHLVAPPSLDYVLGPEHPPSPEYVPGPEHPPSPVEASLFRKKDSNSVEDPEEGPEKDHADYPANRGDDDDEPSDDDDDDTDDEDEEPFEDEDDDEEEEHLAPADSSDVPIFDPVPSARDTEAFETDESAPTPRSPQIRIPFAQTRLRRARKTVRLEPPMSPSMEARIAEYVAAPSPPSPPPSPLLPWYEVGESSTIAPRPTGGHKVDYGFIGTTDAKIRRQRAEEVGYGIWVGLRYGDDWSWIDSFHLSSATTVGSGGPSFPVRLGHIPTICLQKVLCILQGLVAIVVARAVDAAGCVDTPMKNCCSLEHNQSYGVLRNLINMKLFEIALLGMKCGLCCHNRKRRWNQWLGPNISYCNVVNQVKFATCTFLWNALTWWNFHMKTVTQDVAYAMDYKVLKKMMTIKYCPRGEIKKLEIELWNLKVKGTDVASYILRFQELALSGKMFHEEIRRDDGESNVYAGNNQGRQQQNKRQNTGRADTAGPGEKKEYTGSLPLCTN